MGYLSGNDFSGSVIVGGYSFPVDSLVVAAGSGSQCLFDFIFISIFAGNVGLLGNECRVGFAVNSPADPVFRRWLVSARVFTWVVGSGVKTSSLLPFVWVSGRAFPGAVNQLGDFWQCFKTVCLVGFIIFPSGLDLVARSQAI